MNSCMVKNDISLNETSKCLWGFHLFCPESSGGKAHPLFFFPANGKGKNEKKKQERIPTVERGDTIFRCYKAPLWEGLSVRPSVGRSVGRSVTPFHSRLGLALEHRVASIGSCSFFFPFTFLFPLICKFSKWNRAVIVGSNIRGDSISVKFNLPLPSFIEKGFFLPRNGVFCQ